MGATTVLSGGQEADNKAIRTPEDPLHVKPSAAVGVEAKGGQKGGQQGGQPRGKEDAAKCEGAPSEPLRLAEKVGQGDQEGLGGRLEGDNMDDNADNIVDEVDAGNDEDEDDVDPHAEEAEAGQEGGEDTGAASKTSSTTHRFVYIVYSFGYQSTALHPVPLHARCCAALMPLFH